MAKNIDGGAPAPPADRAGTVKAVSEKIKTIGSHIDDLEGVDWLRRSNKWVKALMLLPVEVIDFLVAIGSFGFMPLSIVWTPIYIGVLYAFFGPVKILMGLETVIAILPPPIRMIPFGLIYALFFDKQVVDEGAEEPKGPRGMTIVEMRSRIAEIQSLIGVKRTLLQPIKARHDAAKAALDAHKATEGDIKAKKASIPVEEKKISQKQRLIDRKEAELRRIKTEKDTLARSVKTAEDQLGKVKPQDAQRREELTEKIDRLTVELRTKEADIERLEIEITNAIERNDEVELDLVNMKVEVESFAGDLDALKKKEEGIKAEAKPLEDAIAALNAEMLELQAVVDLQVRTNRLTRPEVRELREQAKEERRMLPSLVDSIKSLLD